MQMRELYDKYHTKGLEIYMVSLDDNEHFWKESVANLPWITFTTILVISEHIPVQQQQLLLSILSIVIIRLLEIQHR